MTQFRRAAVLAAVITLATAPTAQAAPTFTGVTYIIDALTLVATFSERELPADTDTRVEVTARSWAVYECIKRNGEPSGLGIVDPARVQTAVHGTSNRNGVYNDAAYVDPGIVYPDCPSRQYAHLVRVCYRDIVLTDTVSGAVYENPDLARVCQTIG
jgi:hypothetical protein